MHSLVAVANAVVMPTITGKEAAMLILRWFHFLAGITWVGLLYFFNLVNVPFMKTVDAPAKPNVFQNLTLPALNWFRWSALATVFIGFWYWGQFLVAPDAEREGRSGGSTIGLFLLIWIVVFWILYFVIKKIGAQRLSPRRNHGNCGVRRGMAVREPHSGRRGRQSRTLHRSRRRIGPRDAVQRLGHHLAQQQEDHPRRSSRSPTRGRRQAGPPSLPGLANKFLFVGPHALLHGRSVALRKHGDFREVRSRSTGGCRRVRR